MAVRIFALYSVIVSTSGSFTEGIIAFWVVTQMASEEIDICMVKTIVWI